MLQKTACIRVASGALQGEESDGKGGGSAGKVASSSMHSNVSARQRLIKQ